MPLHVAITKFMLSSKMFVRLSPNPSRLHGGEARHRFREVDPGLTRPKPTKIQQPTMVQSTTLQKHHIVCTIEDNLCVQSFSRNI